ncbi:MAG: 2-isopropylmalate synthase [Epsilonproteobacteria bacterium]|nr:2-isopropylmalate synthase [Campylobacterota bacterium]OIO17929.1 MAG: 2-isopropylmalate synthase [Helicobacteraceae bacterium CG1_02_36_14]PIP09335.1 MAG: 2-isopropylmalate synthase [Sulfurimonas sp. CG23_combo_of_CG06-09_8_20_14_all_36_33]PIS24388.1 MAG: 2-isopropylmalate synthase [Sulfurimonas sp. CG08_land_8_20_14_0_20_36_33]PIU34473.1 MAG: 2-isopropylmalate synthase [Sulfurimonas sp. CG07_land_8_20_14_0_80_36_56]PIV03104.1 MAG: 2-isopropylmalate synthase [Sulfurimonas sp. CG03_land_8_2
MNQIAQGKYRPYPKIDLPNRKWPDNTITKAPKWCSVDLRDGNQALVNPMDMNKKLELFTLLVKLGFKEIEVGFPSASKVEFDFLRRLVDDKLIPDDVTIQVLVQAREHLIAKTFESLQGVKKATVHIYNSTSTAQRKIVFAMSQEEIIALALEGVDLVKKYEKLHDGQIFLEYSPESFTGTELEYAAKICNAVTERWGISPTRKVIINLPATVEMATPNIYADQIEWMSNHLNNRENVLISTHTHNDRGTSVAATELALLAGADRVEGTLLSNGERTGNVDIITLALNMTSQGVDSELDFSNVNEVIEIVERCTELPTHPRHPYVGELVYTAFSGSHQDAINKGLAFQKRKADSFWEVPYLPIDPKDVGRTYESIIRINSQSGKGGIAYILEKNYAYQLPKAMHPEIGRVVQMVTDEKGRELEAEEILQIFRDTYFNAKEHISLVDLTLSSDKKISTCTLVYNYNGKEITAKGEGNGPIDACKNALMKDYTNEFTINSYFEHSCGDKSSAKAIAYIEIQTDEIISCFGVGEDNDIATASILALFSALNRAFN